MCTRWINIFSRGDKDDWIIGFDCAHLGDLNPTFLLNDMNYNIYLRRIWNMVGQSVKTCEQISEFSFTFKRDKILNSILN
jgi:hypothetical protein